MYSVIFDLKKILNYARSLLKTHTILNEHSNGIECIILAVSNVQSLIPTPV